MRSAPTIVNVTLTNANTEYSSTIGLFSRIEFQARTAADIRFAFETGKVATPTAPYMTLKAGDYYFTEDASPTILYLASATAGTVVELLVWS